MLKETFRSLSKSTASLSFPSKTSVSLSFDSNAEWWTTFIAPSDGYLFIRAVAANEEATVEIQDSIKSTNYGVSAVWAVVEKGKTHRYGAKGATRTATFVPCRFV